MPWQQGPARPSSRVLQAPQLCLRGGQQPARWARLPASWGMISGLQGLGREAPCPQIHLLAHLPPAARRSPHAAAAATGAAWPAPWWTSWAWVRPALAQLAAPPEPRRLLLLPRRVLLRPAPQPIWRTADSGAVSAPRFNAATRLLAGGDMPDGIGGSASGGLHLEGMPAHLSLLPAAPHPAAFQHPLLDLGLVPMHGLPTLHGYGGWQAGQGGSKVAVCCCAQKAADALHGLPSPPPPLCRASAPRRDVWRAGRGGAAAAAGTQHGRAAALFCHRQGGLQAGGRSQRAVWGREPAAAGTCCLQGCSLGRRCA